MNIVAFIFINNIKISRIILQKSLILPKIRKKYWFIIKILSPIFGESLRWNEYYSSSYTNEFTWLNCFVKSTYKHVNMVLKIIKSLELLNSMNSLLSCPFLVKAWGPIDKYSNVKNDRRTLIQRINTKTCHSSLKRSLKLKNDRKKNDRYTIKILLPICDENLRCNRQVF